MCDKHFKGNDITNQYRKCILHKSSEFYEELIEYRNEKCKFEQNDSPCYLADLIVGCVNPIPKKRPTSKQLLEKISVIEALTEVEQKIADLLLDLKAANTQSKMMPFYKPFKRSKLYSEQIKLGKDIKKLRSIEKNLALTLENDFHDKNF
jgi:serine/threonine protein kinase